MSLIFYVNEDGGNGSSKSSDVDLTAFSSDAPVSTASHFPPPSNDFGTTVEGASVTASVQDPFDMSGFGESLARTRYHTSPGYLETTNSNSTDDILGVLAQPIETFTKPKAASPKPVSPSPKPVSRPTTTESSDEEEDTERDRAIASIVEMGFTIGQATKALSQTSSGTDVQQALNTLLSRPSSSASVGRPTSSSSARLERPPPGTRRTPDPLARMREQQSSQQKDISQIAGGVGSSLLKGAGSLWKSGREKVSTLIQEYNGEMEDPSVPKWMREQQRHASTRRTQDVVTNEARALEARDGKAPVRRNGVHRSEAMEREGSRPGSGSGVPKDRLALRKQIEEEAEMGYRSSSRRRPPNRTNTPSQDPPSRTTTPSTKTPAPIIDLFSSTAEDIPKPVSQRPSRTQTPQSRPVPTNPSTPKPQRVVPLTSDSALSSSHTSRQKGSEAFKVGDYSLALTHYTSALNPLPSSHPQRIIILSNRAITNITLGDAKAAVLDCDDLIREVGPGRGEGEMVNDMDGAKNLREIWGKGVIRRAMALEMLEKYSEALEMWKVAVDAGIGGTPSLEGKRRCESALGINPTQATSMSRSSSTPLSRGNTPVHRAPVRSSTPVVRPKVTRPQGPSATENLAQYNKSVAADEDEKTRLYDTVDARITTWKTGKESNIRALLSSLDGVLWAEAGWKKVSMAELVVVSKVKIVYMKAIAKLHPDKVSHPWSSISFPCRHKSFAFPFFSLGFLLCSYLFTFTIIFFSFLFWWTDGRSRRMRRWSRK